MIVKKITTGFVIQSFDTKTNKFVSQEFITSDQCDYEDEKGNLLNNLDFTEEIENAYLPFNMVQPTDKV
jgi:hypothetical protein